MIATMAKKSSRMQEKLRVDSANSLQQRDEYNYGEVPEIRLGKINF
jgi:hypothetical protein